MVQNLVPDDAHHLEALLASHRIDQHVAMDPNEVFGVEYAVLILNSKVRRIRRHIDAGRGALLVRIVTWPAVSMISVAKSWPFTLMTLLKVFSIVG